ncbi:transposase [Dyella sp. Tek66A03]|jgi:transposase|uniref:transposase n=1 Tax=Dyella sp. Tek66A03 TaxID=3458298 RepID=UPI00403E837D
MGHRKIAAAVKAEAIRLVVEAGYSPPQAAQLTGVGPTALRRWVQAWRAHQAQIPSGVADQQRLIRELQEQLKASEEAREALAQERDTLKKSLPSHLAVLFQRRRRSTR